VGRTLGGSANHNLRYKHVVPAGQIMRSLNTSRHFFLKFLGRKPKLWHSEASLDERRFLRADGKRPLPPRMAQPKG
jgi:hypothetical protein